MKSLKFLLIMVLAVLILPFSVLADDEEAPETVAAEESKEVNVYLFRGEGCPHCQEAEEWFSSIEEEYGEYFKVVDYETWYNEDNAKLMEEVADTRGEEASGVPYIIVGNKSWNGFAESYEDEILEAIKSEYDTAVDERYDIMKLVSSNQKKGNKKSSTGSDVLSLIIILVIVAAICFGIYKARKSTN